MAIGGLEQRPSYPQRHVSRGGPEWESDIEANVNLDVINALLGGVGKAIGNETMAKGTLIPTPKAIMADMARTSEENRRSEADVSQMGALRAQGIDIPDSDYDRVLRARGLLTGAAPAPGAGVPSPGTSTPVPVGPGPVLPPDLNAGILPAAAAGAVPIVGPETPLSGGEQAMGLREAPPTPTAPVAMRGEPAPARESTGNPMLDMFASFMGMMEGGKGAAERPTTTTPGGVRLSRPAGKEGTGGLKASDFISLIKEVGEQGRHKEKEKRGKEEFHLTHGATLAGIEDKTNQTKIALGKFLSDNQDKMDDNQREASRYLPLMVDRVKQELAAGNIAEAEGYLGATNGMARQSGTGEFVIGKRPSKLLGIIPWGDETYLDFVPKAGMRTGEKPAEASTAPTKPMEPGRSVGDFLGTAPAAAAIKPAGKTKLDAIKEIPSFFQKSSKASPDFDKSLAGQSQYESLFQKEVAKYKDVPGMSVELARAVVAQESRFDPKAKSARGAKGLFQLMPAAASDQKVKNREDPAENTRGGVGHLAMLLKRYKGDIDKTLAAYNWGHAKSRVDPDKPLDFTKMPKETRDYVSRVKGYMQTAQKTGRMGPSTTALASAKALADPQLARAARDTTIMGLVDIIDVARRGGQGDAKVKERALAHGATPEQIALAFRVAGQV